MTSADQKLYARDLLFAHPVTLSLQLFDERYRRVIFALEVLLAGRFPDEMAASLPTPGMIDLKAGW